MADPRVPAIMIEATWTRQSCQVSPLGLAGIHAFEHPGHGASCRRVPAAEALAAVPAAMIAKHLAAFEAPLEVGQRICEASLRHPSRQYAERKDS